MSDSTKETNEIKEPKLIKVKNKVYHLYNMIDNGAYGKVNLIEGSVDKKKYALKILLNNDFKEDFENEINIYEYFNKINNVFIPKFCDSDTTIIEPNENANNVFIIDYAEKGDLFYYFII